MDKVRFLAMKGKAWPWLAAWLGAVPLLTLSLVLALGTPQESVAANTILWLEVKPPATSGTFVSLVGGDVNEDGHMDLIGGSLGLGIYGAAGQGNGDWTALGAVTTSGTWYGLALGDVNNDGKLDLVGAEDGSGIHVWTGDGAGGWTVMTSPAGAGRIWSVALGDINNDGNLDIAAGSGEGAGLRVWTGDGAGGWAAASTDLPITGVYADVALGDVDRDGRPDLVAASHGGGVRAWQWDGASWTAHLIGLLPAGDYYGVALGDLDNDGDLDLVASGDGVGVRAWTVNAWNWIDASTGLPENGQYWDVGLSDVNNDGKLDIAATSYGNGVRVWLGNGGGAWSEASSGLPSTGAYYGLALGDWNDDGMVDLSAGQNAGVQAWVDDGTPDALGGWVQIASPTTSGVHQGVDVGDFDHDGKLDVLAATDGDGLQLWTGDGGNAWTDVASWTNPDLPTTGTYHTPALADIDNDGYLDVIASRGTAGGIQAWRYINVGWHDASAGLPPPPGVYGDLDTGDFDDDGYVDLVAVGQGLGVKAWRGNGGTSWALTMAGLPSGGTFLSVALRDIDRDGYLDIVAGSNGSGIGVWQGMGTGWGIQALPTSTGVWRGIALGDVNDDGNLDIVAAEDSDGVAVWAGDGGFGWTPLTSPAIKGNFWGLDLGDFNNDGALDVAAGTADGKGILVWAGDGGSSWAASSTNLPVTGEYPAVRFGEIDNDGLLDLVGARQGSGSVHAWTGAEGAPPSGWANFAPSGWTASVAPMTLSIEVHDSGTGLHPLSALYSTWEGGAWSAWKPADCTCAGSPGVTTTQTISATGVIFSQDSGPFPHTRNQIRFRVSDMAGNTGYSDAYIVYLDRTPPTNPTDFPDSSHWPSGGWENLNEIRVENWTGDTDATSGVHGFSYVFSTTYELPDTTPETGGGYRVANSGVLQDGEWYIYMRTRDTAGNWAADASFEGPYRIDTGPPTNPTGFDSSHERWVWSNDNTIRIDWWGAEDGGSGVRGYGFSWTEAPLTSPDAILKGTETFTTSRPLDDGNSWYFHIKTVDRAGNWTSDTVHRGPFYIDTGKPTSQATSPAIWYQPDFVVRWSGIDGLSGVVAYDIQVRDVYEGDSWETWLLGTTVLSDTFHGVQGHTYEFISLAIDQAGNVEDWPVTADTTTAIVPYDFEAYGLEVTQAIQDLNNSVVLVTDKRTFVRFHVRSNSLGDQGPVEARLTGRRDGTSLGELIPNNPGGTITVLESPDREVLDHSFYFELPNTWLHGTVTLEAEVDPDNDYAESDTGNNTQTVDVTFGDSPEVTVKIVDACYEHGGVTYHADNLHRNMLASWLRRAYPIATLHVRTGAFTPCMDELPTARQVNRILRRDMRDRGEEDVANLRYYGMIDDGGDFVRGRASFNRHMASGPVGCCEFGWDSDGSYGDWYGGHELGHTWDRRHAEFCGAEGGRDYPYPFGDISPPWPPNARIYGFDIETLEIYPPDWKEMMTYCDNIWISDFTYEALRDEMLAEESAALMRNRQATARPAAEQPFLEVYGSIITATDEVTLDTFWVTTANWTYTPCSGDYSIRLLDAAESMLADYPFTPLAGHLEPGPTWQAVGSSAQSEMADIDEYVPWVAGTRRIAIYHGSQELASRLVSAHTPVVALTGPANGDVISGGQIDLSWVGSDGDGDPLTYWLEYSTDGGAHWQLLTGELYGSGASLDTGALAGTSQGKLRLAASDGVNTGRDETQGTFTIWNKPPEVAIISPSPGAVYATGQTIALWAQALDLEDGSLTGTALSWHSDLEGTLGTGELMHVTDLTTGTHRITLTATDSDGGVATDTVTIFVGVSPHKVYLPFVLRK